MLIERNVVTQQLQKAIREANRRQDLFATLIVRLNGLASFRQHLGYDIADQIVADARERLSAAIDSGDWIGQLADDELIVVSHDCNSPSCAIKGARRLIDVLDEVREIDGHRFTLHAHIGIALYPVDAGDPLQILKRACFAVQLAERPAFPDRYAFFNRELGQRAADEFGLQQQLRGAISRGDFALYLQPKIDLPTSELIGAEALIRWPQPDGSVRSPAEFLPIAERGGLMRPLGRWVANEACRIRSAWQQGSLKSVPISINVSADQFDTENWLPSLEHSMAAAGVDPCGLMVEITESVAMADLSSTLEQLERLHALGIQVSIDDFGTGFSNLALLARFSFDEVKIDRSLIRHIGRSGPALSICEAIARLGGVLGVKVIAEGIEREEQVEVARAIGCDGVQGYFFGRPVPVVDFERRWMKPALCAATSDG